MGQVATAICGKLLGSSAFCQSKCRNINCCTSSAGLKVYDPFSRPPWMQQPPVYDPRWPRQQPRAPTDGSDTELPSERFACKKLKLMTSIWVDSRKRAAGTDADFEFDVGQTVHLQGSARLSVFKIRVADTFLSTDEKRPLSLHYFGVWGSELRVEGLGLGLRMLKTVAGAASSQQPFGAQSKLKTDSCGLVS